MNNINQYLKEIHDNALMNNYEIRPSPIQGNGVFATKPIRKGDFVNTHFKAGYEITDFGKHLNHSQNANARSIRQDDKSFKTYAERDINPDDEITLDYTQNKDLEQPQDDWNIQETVTVREPPDTDGVEVQVDTSDEASITFSPKSNPKNARTNEGGAETVFGQGSNPKPEDETYLSLLKGTTMTRAKVKIKEKEEDKDTIEVDVNKSPTEGNPLLKPVWYGGPKS